MPVIGHVVLGEDGQWVVEGREQEQRFQFKEQAAGWLAEQDRRAGAGQQ